jgi:hypothetical protein
LPALASRLAATVYEKIVEALSEENLYNRIYPIWEEIAGADSTSVIEVADRTLTPIVESISDANGDATILYSLTKEAAERWNMIIGGQYQIDKHFQIRAEGGIVGNRKSFLLSANYRFGIKHK